MKFLEEVEDYFWNNTEKQDIVIGGRSTTILDEAIHILQLQENEVQEYIDNNPELISVFTKQEAIIQLPEEDKEINDINVEENHE